jgi:hypothetical protein
MLFNELIDAGNCQPLIWIRQPGRAVPSLNGPLNQNVGQLDNNADDVNTARIRFANIGGSLFMGHRPSL